MGTLEKLNALENRDSYIVDTIIDYISNTDGGVSRDNICDQLTKNYLRKKASVNVDIDVEIDEMNQFDGFDIADESVK